MGGTIRCSYDGCVLNLLEADHKGTGVSVLQCPQCGRNVTIPSSIYSNVVDGGGNFTHVYFSSKDELTAYLKEHADRFLFVGNSNSQISENLWGIVF